MTAGGGLDVASPSWGRALARACGGSGVVATYQPIVDVCRGVVAGYEALARFEGGEGRPAGERREATPDVWFAAARAHGCEARLEAAALGAALERRADLPPNCFLTVNLGPATLGSREVNAVLAAQPSLAGVVLEVTEHTVVASYTELVERLAVHRARGALVAVDDAGAGYSGLQHILSLRPAFLKLDRALVEDVDRDTSKRALIEAMGSFADRIDAWLIAEGIERWGELQVVAQLGVPLAQGFLLARPGPPWVGVQPGVAERLRSLDRRLDGAQLRPLIEVAPWLDQADVGRAAELLSGAHTGEVLVVLDGNRRPCGLLDASHALVGDLLPVLSVAPTTLVSAAARRALTRPPAERFLPLVCADGTGRYLGIVRLERIVEHLAGRADADTDLEVELPT